MKNLTPGHSESSYSSWFLLLVTLSVTALITSNVIGSKLVRLGGYVLPAGILVFRHLRLHHLVQPLSLE